MKGPETSDRMRLPFSRLWTGCIAAALIAIVAVWVGVRHDNSPVSILLITLDTTRADRLGCYGYAAAETPHLDALAKRGISFERAYAPAPMTAPSHASMFTGLWPPEHGVFTNGQTILGAGIPTVAESIQRRAYDTAAFVAAFVLHSKFGLNRGFNVYDDDLSQAKATNDELHQSRDGRLVIDSCIRWLTRQQQQSPRRPFFCWVHLYDAHEPYRPHADQFADRFADRPYDAEIAYTDQLVGRLFQSLEKLGVAKSTYIMVVGDHGESLGEHGERTHGFMLHDSTLRVPLIVADPRHETGGRHVATPVPLIDVFPTLLEAAGVRVPDGISGHSLQTAFSRKVLEPRICYSQTDEPYLQAFWCPLRGLTTERWRYVRSTRPELYDLTADPQELVNLAETQPDIAEEFEDQLATFEEKLRRNSGTRVALSPQEQRVLESLGYTGSRNGGLNEPRRDPQRPDIKDMISHLNRLDDALHFIEDRDFDTAARLLEPLAIEVPKLLRAPLNLGLCRLMQQKYDDAARWLLAALEIDPRCDRAHDMLGFAYLKLGQLDLAEQQFKQLLELRPDSQTGHLFLGEVHQRKGDLSAAIHHYTIVLKINPQNRAAREAVQELRQALSAP